MGIRSCAVRSISPLKCRPALWKPLIACQRPAGGLETAFRAEFGPEAQPEDELEGSLTRPIAVRATRFDGGGFACLFPNVVLERGWVRDSEQR
jgi:hypothetical protein